MISDPDVRIIVVAFNSGDYLQDCLYSLSRQTHSTIEVIIVDNGGTPHTNGSHVISLPDARFSHWDYSENTGFSGGFHRGAESATTKWIMSVNPDTLLDADCIENLLHAASIHNDPEMLSPCLFSSENRDRLDGVGDTLSAAGIAWRNAQGRNMCKVKMKPESEVFSPTGAAALYLREAYENAGGINPAFFCYMEDIDLGLRIRGYGGLCIQVNAAKGIHVGGHSTEGLAGFAVRHFARNALMMIVSSAPLLLLFPLLGLHILGQSWLQWRTRGTEAAKYRLEGYREFFTMLPCALEVRLRRNAYPLGASFRIIKRLSWSFSDLRNRPAIHWPI